MTKDFAYNCDPCKRRKKRCDRIQPCSNCVLYSCQSDCYSTLTQAKSLASTQGITASNQQRPIGVHTYADARHRRRSESPSEKYKKAYYSQDRYHDNAISTSSKPLERSKADKNSLVSELAFSLPALDMCFTFLDFAGTILNESSFLDIETLQKSAAKISAREDVPHRQASLLFWTLAVASQHTPSRHTLADSYIDLKKSAQHWKTEAIRLYTLVELSSDPNDTLIDVYIYAMQSMWYSKSGIVQESWLATGIGLRKAASIHLFDHTMRKGDNSKGKDEHAFLVAHRLLLMDRWLSFNNLCPHGIARVDLDVSSKGPFALRKVPSHASSLPRIFQSNAEGHSLQVCLEQKQVILLELGYDLRRRCQYADESERDYLRQEALSFLQDLDLHRQNGLDLLFRHLGVSSSNGENFDASILDNLDIEKAIRIAEWISACAYTAFVSLMPFIRDKGAPLELQQSSVRNSVEILKVSDTYTKAIKSGHLPLWIPRIANQIFSGFRAIIVAIAKEDPLGSQTASLLSDANTEAAGSFRDKGDSSTALACCHSLSGETSGSAASTSYEITSLRANVLSGMDCIEELRTQGSSIAEKVYLLVREASHRHPILDQVFSKRDANLIPSINSYNGGIPSYAQAQNPPIGACESSSHDYDALVKALFSSSGSESTSQNHELEAILTSFLNDVPM